MAIVFKTPKSTLNTTSKAIQNLGGDCPPCPEPVLEGKELNYTQNGEYTVTPEQGVDGFSSIDVTVNVPSDVNNQDKTVSPSTSSQTVSADSGYTGLGTVTVNAVTSSIDNNISAGNIKKDVTILGVTGSYDPQPALASANIVPATSAQTITPPAGIDGYSRINVTAVTSSIDQNIAAGNIKDGVTILGVTGNYSGSAINNQNKTVSPSTSQQSVSADQGYTGLGTVTVNAVTAAIDANIVAENILDGVTILGVTGSDMGYDAGYSDGYAQGQAECPEPGGCDNTAYVQETITTNGTYTYDPSDYQGDSYDAFDGVEIVVNVPSSGTNIPDWSSIGWTSQDVTDSGIVADVAYTATVKDNNVWTNDKSLTFAPKQSNSNSTGIFRACTELVYVPDFTLTGGSSTYQSMFDGCKSLERVGNITRTSTSSCSAALMFSDCLSLKSIASIDTEGVTDMSNMFVVNVANITLQPTFTPPVMNTASVTSMANMFNGRGGLTAGGIDIISNYNTSSVTNMASMFNLCYVSGPSYVYQSVLDTAPSFNTSNVQDFSGMFSSSYGGVTGTLVTVPQWNMSSARSINQMFSSQDHLTNLGGFVNLGKAFSNQEGAAYHTLDLSASAVLTKQSIMNVINNLAAPDDTNVNDATLKLNAASYALLDASDIAIATAKNWSVISA